MLLLDEPLSALDRRLRQEMQVELMRIQRESGLTTIFVTHDQEEALTLSDRVAILDRGRIVQDGRPAEIYERPRTRFAASSWATPTSSRAGRRPGALRSGECSGHDGPLPATGAALTLAVRPEKMLLLHPASRARGHERGAGQGHGRDLRRCRLDLSAGRPGRDRDRGVRAEPGRGSVPGQGEAVVAWAPAHGVVLEA